MRIVGGAAKGRRLATPARVTRPTSDQVREALFNTLSATLRLDDARVLDLYAGTGAVGLEALSRGAADVVLVEKDRAALEVIRRNVATVGLDGATVVPRSVSAYLGDDDAGPFDLVFIDPPYELDTEKVADTIVRLHGNGWLAPGAHVVIERSTRSAPVAVPEVFVTRVAEKRYGETLLWYGRAR